MYSLSDEVISQIAKLVQLAIITGTDIVDNLRMMDLEQDSSDSGTLTLTDEYRSVAEMQVQALLEELESSEAVSLED